MVVRPLGEATDVVWGQELCSIDGVVRAKERYLRMKMGHGVQGLLRGMFLGLCFVLPAAAGIAPSYQLVDLGPGPAGLPMTYGYGVYGGQYVGLAGDKRSPPSSMPCCGRVQG